MNNNYDVALSEALSNIDVKEALDLAEEMSLPLRKLMCYYTCAMMEIETKFKVLNEEFNLKYDRNPIDSIKCRIKKFESIIEKLHRKKLPLSIESIEKNLNDVAGVRIICTFPDDVYKLAESLLKQDDIILVEEKDYIKHPKSNGYRSLHLIVSVPIFLQEEKKYMNVEIQIRTIAMNFWASLEHQMRYKKDNTDELLAQELKVCANISAELDLRMEKIKKKIAGEEK